MNAIDSIRDEWAVQCRSAFCEVPSKEAALDTLDSLKERDHCGPHILVRRQVITTTWSEA